MVILFFVSQAADAEANADVGRREKARLKELQKIKKHKIQEILDAQNASIDADMVSLCTLILLKRGLVFYLLLDFGPIYVNCDVDSVFHISVLTRQYFCHFLMEFIMVEGILDVLILLLWKQNWVI